MICEDSSTNEEDSVSPPEEDLALRVVPPATRDFLFEYLLRIEAHVAEQRALDDEVTREEDVVDLPGPMPELLEMSSALTTPMSREERWQFSRDMRQFTKMVREGNEDEFGLSLRLESDSDSTI